MFFTKIYQSWNLLQKQKYRKIFSIQNPKGLVLEIGSSPFTKGIIIDINPDELKKAKGIKVLADANFLPFKPDTFNTIICIDTIHLIKKGFTKVLKKNGLLILSIFYNKQNYIQRLKLLKKFSKNAKGSIHQLPGQENELVFIGQNL